jgi:hypothetical protein
MGLRPRVHPLRPLSLPQPTKAGCPMSRFLRHGIATSRSPSQAFIAAPTHQSRVPHVSIFETWDCDRRVRPLRPLSLPPTHQSRVPHVSLLRPGILAQDRRPPALWYLRPMPPVLETNRLLLRPLELSDAEQVQCLFPQWEIVQYLNAVVPWPYPPDGALSVLPRPARCPPWRAATSGTGPCACKQGARPRSSAPSALSRGDRR